MRRPVLRQRIVLCCYAMSGTETACGAICLRAARRCPRWGGAASSSKGTAIMLRVCSAMSGTEIAYGATRQAALSGAATALRTACACNVCCFCGGLRCEMKHACLATPLLTSHLAACALVDTASSNPLRSYESAMRCPVLTWAMLLPASYGNSLEIRDAVRESGL
eukprot:3885898-Rhodomonas_salina.5